MAKNCYDCFFLFDSNRYNRDPGGVVANIQKAVEEVEGEVMASRLWEEGKLAYPINGQNKGTYWITYFRMEGGKLADFNRTCQLNEDILRFLVTKVDPRLIDTLVAHTMGTHAGEESEQEETAAESTTTANA